MHKPRTIRLSLIAAAVACCFTPGVANSNPVGPTVTHGQASFSQQGKLLTVTNSPASIIQWQGFSIAAGETTRFVQQSAASAVLNRVVGADPSSILGALQSNGRVWLINPNGIIFGAGAQIDTAGLVASTLNIMNADFLNGRMRFGDTPGAKSISNAGEIRTPAGGRVLLIAPQGVENSGIIHSPKGEVILAAGKSVEIADSTNPEVRIEVAAPEARALNLGKIVAESGRIGIYGGIVTNRGLVSADSAVVGENGKIAFRATREVNLAAGSVTTASGASGGRIEVGSEGTTLVSGVINATGSAQSGGQVQVLGGHVGLIGDALVDASGAGGGGAVLIGGDYQGANPSVRNAQMTYIAPSAAIKADAITNGDGGKVIVWADDTTRSHGSISARGGALGGNGGFVETSGKRGLEVTRGPDVRAPAGINGTWLLDPDNDIEVVASIELTNNTGAPFFSPTGDSSRVAASLINDQLAFGSNVEIRTATQPGGTGTQGGTVTISAPIEKAANVAGGIALGPTSFKVTAGKDIVIAPGVAIRSLGDPMSVTLNAGGASGTVTVGGEIVTNGRGPDFLGVSISGPGGVFINAPINTLTAAGATNAFPGTVVLTSSAGAVNVASTIASGGAFSASGNTAVALSAPVTTGTGNVSTTVCGFVNFCAGSATGAVNVGGSVTATGAISLSGSTGVAVSAPMSGTSTFSATSAAGAVTIGANVSNNSTMTLSGNKGVHILPGVAINTGFGRFNVTVADAASSFDHDAGAMVMSRGATLKADNMEIQGQINADAQSVLIVPSTSGRMLDLGSNTTGKLSLTHGEVNNVATTSSFNIGDSVTPTGAITVSNSLNVSTPSSVTVTSGSTVDVNAAVVASVPVTVNAPGAITLSAPVSGTSLSVSSSTSVVQNPGATINASGSLTISAPIINSAAAMNGTPVTLNADQMVLGSTVTSGSNIFIGTASFVPIDVGATAHSATPTNLELTVPEVNTRLVAASGIVHIGSTSNDMLTVKNAIAPTGTSTLVLSSGNSIAQDPGATITVATLGLNVFGDVILPLANQVDTLAASLCCAGNSFVFANAAGKPLAIATINTPDLFGAPSITGVSNFNSDASTSAMFTADSASVPAASPINFFAGTVSIQPASVAKVDLGGANQAGVMGLGASAPNIFTGKLIVKADQVDVSAPVIIGADSLNIAPLTTAPAKNLNVIAGVAADPMKNPANLEITQGDINNVTVGSLILGDAATGPVTVATALNVAGNVSNTFGLHSGSSISIPNNLTAQNSVRLIADSLNPTGVVTSTSGSITVGPSTAGTPVDLGNLSSSLPAQKLGLTKPVIETNLMAPSGGLVFQTDNVLEVSDALLISGGNMTLAANQVRVNNTLTTRAGDVNIGPFSSRSMTIGTDDTVSTLGLTTGANGELVKVMPSGFLRLGDSTNTQSITITQPIDPAGIATGQLSLVAGTGSVSQNTNATIVLSGARKLAVRANSGITLTQNNDIDFVAAQTTSFGNIQFRNVGANPLAIDTVDGVVGVQAAGGSVTMIANQIAINQDITANFGFGTVTLRPVTAGQLTSLGAKPGASSLGVFETELQRIHAQTLVIGDTNATTGSGNATVDASINIPASAFQNLTLNTMPTASITVANPLTVPQGITFNSGSLSTTAAVNGMNGFVSTNLGAGAANIGAAFTGGSGVSINSGSLTSSAASPITSAFGSVNVNVGAGAVTLGDAVTASSNIFISSASLTTAATAPITSTSGSVTLTMDDAAIGAAVASNASFGTTSVLPKTPTRNTNLGGNVSTELSLDATEFGLLSGSKVAIVFSPTINVSAAVTTPSPLSITTDNLLIPSGASLTAPSLAIGTTTSGRQINLGTIDSAIPATFLGLDDPTLNRIIANSLAFTGSSGTGNGTITVSNPITLTNVQDLTLSAGSSGAINVNSALSVPNNISFTANTMAIAGLVTSTAGGTISVARSSFGTMLLGAGTGGLVLDNSEISQFSTSGALRLGNTSTTSSMSIGAPISSGTVGALALIANGAITQTAGSTITAPNLMVQNFSTVALPENNAVGTLAASTSGNFAFTNVGALNVGSVDGVNGITNTAFSGSVTLKADQLTLAQGIHSNSSTGTVTLAPRVADASIDLGSTPPGVFGITDAAVDMITANVLNFGTSTSGSITVTAAVDRENSRDLALIAGSGHTISVKAPLGSETTRNITMTTGTGGAINVGDTVTAVNSINMTADNVNIGALLKTTGSSVSIQPASSGLAISLGAETSGALSLSATELGLIATDQLSVGNSTAGPLTITAAIGPFTFDSLTLVSGAAITQLPSATITVNNPNTNPALPPTGTLNVFSSGGAITLTENNNIAQSLSGSASGPGNNFQFNNIGPLKLQNVSATATLGQVKISGGVVTPPPVPEPVPVPPPAPILPLPPDSDGGSTQNSFVNDPVNSTLRAAELQENADKEADVRNEDAEKKQIEDDKKEGRKSC